ncbi:MAG: class I SAM-dependent methyltransferase [Deltaproteobacteria bacterium]|nr:class I SAM-dependent methyltransferase [Deltaproteobacteria bacterium]
MRDDFTKDGVKNYAKTRYSKADQRFVHRREETILRTYLKRAAGDRGLILDIPCGYGRFSPLLLEFSSGVIGSDLSLSMVGHVLNQHPRSTHKLWGVVGDAVKGMPFRSEAFMGVVSIRLFQHLHKRSYREAALEEFARLTQRFVILSYYRRNALHTAQRRLRRRLKPTQTTINMVTHSEFLEEIHKAGLECISEKAVLKGLHAHHFVLLQKLGV